MKLYPLWALSGALTCFGLTTIVSHAQSAALNTPTEGIYGELRQWHRVTVAFEGPNTNEGASPNPFFNFRLDVTFTHSSGRTITVPGYYASDGHAGETSATSGNIWRVHFTPPLTGTWNYSASFKQGNGVAINTGGSNNNTINGDSGSFNVQVTNKTGRDFRAHGRLSYVNAHHLRHEGSGRWFFKFGADSPENFLAYDDIDNTPANGRTGIRHTWQPHEQDWNTNNPQWKNNRGRGGIGAINYLAGQGAHSISTLTYTIDGGDDGRTFPWVQGNNKFRFDTSKLDQWEILFQHMNNSGLNITIKLAEEENWEDTEGNVLRLYYREMVARFGHHLGLTWVVSEEFGGFSIDQSERDELQFRGDLLAGLDPWDNNLVAHTGPGQKTLYDSLYGRNAYTGASLQVGNADTTQENVFRDTLNCRNDSSDAGRPWICANDEQGPANEGVREQSAGDRKFTIWGNFMAGGAGTEFYLNQASGGNLDASLEDYRRISTMWKWARHCVNDFIYGQNIPFWEMANADNLINGNLNHCLAKPGDVYVIYLANGGSTSLNLNGQSGTYSVRWFDPRNGGSLQNGSVTSINGGGSRGIGSPPNASGSDWAVLVRKTGGGGGGPVTLSFAGPSPAANASLPVGSDLSVEVTASAGVSNMRLFLNGTIVRQENVSPYEWGVGTQNDPLLQNLAAGTYTLRVEASLSGGGTVDATRSITVGNSGGSPFGGTARAIPGQIEAEDFDNGGQGVAYNDTDADNNGSNNYRSGTDVDIQNRTGSTNGRNIGWIADGEWLQYTTNVAAGTYDIEVRVASQNSNPGDLEVVLDGDSLGTFPVVTTGGWGTWQVLRISGVSVSGGNGKILRLNMLSGGNFNLDWIRFVASSGGGGTPQTVSATPSDDAFLQNGNRNGGNLLRVQPAGPTRESYLKFSVTGVNGTTTGSELELTVSGDAGSGTIQVYRGTTNSWNEDNLSNANAPARGALLGSTSGSFGIGSVVTVDLGNSITGNGTVSLIVVLANGGNDTAFSSKEGANDPVLRVDSQ